VPTLACAPLVFDTQKNAAPLMLTEWLASIHSPAEPIDIMLSGDCNALQAHPRLTRRALKNAAASRGGCPSRPFLPIPSPARISVSSSLLEKATMSQKSSLLQPAESVS
jgi:hypothetical protein